MIAALEMERAMGAFEMDRAAAGDVNAVFKGLGFETDLEIPSLATPQDWNELFVEPLSGTWHNAKAGFYRLVYIPAWKIAWKDQEKLRLFQYWQSVIEIARSQNRQGNWSKASSGAPNDKWEQIREESFASPSTYEYIRFPLSSMMRSFGERALQHAIDAEVARNLLVTAVAIRRYEIAHHRPPADLRELIPQFLDSLPIDSYDGKPLRYRAESDGTFVLYSIGSDGVDDGGKPLPKERNSKPQFLSSRDIVWPRAASTAEIEKMESELR
jgi:hypothetical protein